MADDSLIVKVCRQTKQNQVETSYGGKHCFELRIICTELNSESGNLPFLKTFKF